MKVVTPEMVAGKKVLLRYDIDVPLKKVTNNSGQGTEWVVEDDFRLEAGTPTLEMCLEFADSVVLMGHVGRPQGSDLDFSVKPIVDWFEERYAHVDLPEGVFHILENLRFETGESFDSAQDHGEVLAFAKELAGYGNFFVNESFAGHHPSASTTVLPTLLPHAAGLNFAEEVEEILKVRNNPERPLVSIIGGVKIEDKLPAVLSLSQTSDFVLVGGKIAEEIKTKELNGEINTLPKNVLLAYSTDDKQDIDNRTIDEWWEIIEKAKTVFWNGPLGKVEDPKNTGSKKIAEAIIRSEAFSLVGGGDTVGALANWGLMHKFSFVSTGGGAMLELLVKGTLPTIEALN